MGDHFVPNISPLGRVYINFLVTSSPSKLSWGIRMLLIFSSFIPILKYDSLPISMELFCNINGISTKLSHSLLILPSLIGQFFSPGHHQYPQFTRDVNFLYSYHSFCCNECCYSCITCIQDSTSYHMYWLAIFSNPLLYFPSPPAFALSMPLRLPPPPSPLVGAEWNTLKNRYY